MNQPVPQPRLVGTERRVKRGTHQAHVLIGGPTFGGRDPRRFALLLLNNMLGGPGMNSRLNLSLREKAGLVYSVDSYLNTYPDTGFWNVYFGCDAHDIARCRRLCNVNSIALPNKRFRPYNFVPLKSNFVDKSVYRPMQQRAMLWH